MNTLASGLSWFDLRFLSRPHAIASVVAQGPSGAAIIDPGPSTTLGTLDLELQGQGVQWRDVTDILLTHIHLDHAGATGTILAQHPHIRVSVHERGAPHLIDPSKLVASASRLWPGEMERLWGDVWPVSADHLRVLRGGEQIEAGGRRFEVAYTPGHASHHVSYFEPSTGVAFVGDTAGMSIDGGYVLAPTPPPDIDLEAWRASLATIERWSPNTLFLTHFGPITEVRPHLQALADSLERSAALVRESLAEPGTDEERSARYAERLRRELRRQMGDLQVEAYGLSAPFHLLWLGLARYWRKRGDM